MHTRIKVVCFFYNEEFLLPFFLSHYWWANEIHAVVSKSTDRTEEILRHWVDINPTNPDSRYARVVVESFEFPRGMDDFIKRDKVNEIIGRKQDCDWIIVVDSDEFVWPSNFTGEPDMGDMLFFGHIYYRDFLDAVPADEDVLYAKMWNVFRHQTEKDLDPEDKPVVLQRRHGDADRSSPGNAQYQKPIIIRANRGVQLHMGNHDLACTNKVSEMHFDGVHWQNADPAFCVKRRIKDRRDRLSDTNHRCGLGAQHRVIEPAIVKLCKDHENDPRCF